MNSCRLFFAIQPPAEIVETLQRIQHTLHGHISLPDSKPPPVRWTPAARLHITLLFAPAFPRAELATLQRAAERISAPRTPFEISLNPPELRPPGRRPRLIWLPVSGGVTPLRDIHSALDTCHPSLSPDRGRLAAHPRLRPHLTLGRLSRTAARRVEIQAIRKALDRGNTASIPAWTVQRMDLMESILSSTDPEYQLLRSFPFHG